MKKCDTCGNKLDLEDSIFCKECREKQHAEHYLSHDRYIIALKRIREQIANGSKLKYKDSDSIGDKYITCSWGMCSMYKSQWPDKEDRIRTFNSGLIDTKQQDTNQNCPMDSKQEGEVWGCFYRCRIFQHQKNLPTREEAIQLYDITIKEKDK